MLTLSGPCQVLETRKLETKADKRHWAYGIKLAFSGGSLEIVVPIDSEGDREAADLFERCRAFAKSAATVIINAYPTVNNKGFMAFTLRSIEPEKPAAASKSAS